MQQCVCQGCSCTQRRAPGRVTCLSRPVADRSWQCIQLECCALCLPAGRAPLSRQITALCPRGVPTGLPLRPWAAGSRQPWQWRLHWKPCVQVGHFFVCRRCCTAWTGGGWQRRRCLHCVSCQSKQNPLVAPMSPCSMSVAHAGKLRPGGTALPSCVELEGPGSMSPRSTRVEELLWDNEVLRQGNRAQAAEAAAPGTDLPQSTGWHPAAVDIRQQRADRPAAIRRGNPTGSGLPGDAQLAGAPSRQVLMQELQERAAAMAERRAGLAAGQPPAAPPGTAHRTQHLQPVFPAGPGRLSGKPSAITSSAARAPTAAVQHGTPPKLQSRGLRHRAPGTEPDSLAAWPVVAAEQVSLMHWLPVFCNVPGGSGPSSSASLMPPQFLPVNLGKHAMPLCQQEPAGETQHYTSGQMPTTQPDGHWLSSEAAKQWGVTLRQTRRQTTSQQ